MIYDYNELQKDISKIAKRYPFIQIETIGSSINCRDIYALRLGSGEKEVFYNGTHHALEWITSKLLMRFVFDYCKAYIKGTRIKGYDIRKLFHSVSIYIVPMVNPDGIEIAKYNSKWQANARGVDLNHNYDASWKEGFDIAKTMGYGRPGATKYSGRCPESEPETRAVANFTRSKSFEYVIAFHSQGEVIYWKYGDALPPESEALALMLSSASGYALDETEGVASYSGYKDWFMDKFNRPGFTVEVGMGINPLPLSQFDVIYNDILEMLVLAGV